MWCNYLIYTEYIIFSVIAQHTDITHILKKSGQLTLSSAINISDLTIHGALVPNLIDKNEEKPKGFRCDVLQNIFHSLKLRAWNTGTLLCPLLSSISI